MLKIICFTAIFVAFCCVCEKVRQFFEALQEKYHERECESNLNKVAKKDEVYNLINNFSICLSLDYKKNRKFVKEGCDVLNKVIYERIERFLSKTPYNLKIRNMGKCLIILSDDFALYDKIYDNTLRILSKIKKEIAQRYKIVLIPSITTDAYTGSPNMESISQVHSNIKHCSFMNQACTTKSFAKKYHYLNNEKYLGTPLGEYTIIDKDKENTYNLNMVNRNLSLSLESLG